jgi:hypothetical protein
MLRLISTLAALGRELQEAFSVPQDLPDSITRALARLESSTKTNRPDGAIDGQCGEDLAYKGEGAGVIGRGPAHRRTRSPSFRAISIPVEFNLMQPARSGRWPVRQRRLARQDEAGEAWNGFEVVAEEEVGGRRRRAGI